MRPRKSFSDKIASIVRSSIAAKEAILTSEVDSIAQAAETIAKALGRGRRLFIFGNGGSAADSQHIAAEFVGRFQKERKALPAMALTVNTSSLTAIANDYGYEVSFSRQLEAFAGKGDVALAISTSGNAKNVLEAVKRAKRLGLATIGLAGGDGGELAKAADLTIIVPSRMTARIQESHIMIGHIICELVEEELFGC